MDIRETLEARWFFGEDDACAVTVKAWFDGVPSEGSRVDHYLFTDRDDLSFKPRVAEGHRTKVQTKYLVESLGSIALAPHVTGKIERWKKLSLEAEDGAMQEDGAWLAIAKDRSLRKFSFAAGSVAEVEARATPDAGCGVELTRLRYTRDAGKRTTAWTFGLEAFGPAPQLPTVLQACSRLVFVPAARLAFDDAASRSYAGWLAGLRRDEMPS